MSNENRSSPTRIFLDKRVFQHDYVPDWILHRDAQVDKIRLILSDTESGTRPRNILCIGSFGTGKTAAVRRFCQTLTEDITPVYLICSEVNTQSRILREVLRQLRNPINTGFPIDHYLAAFKDAAKKHPWVVLILDEVDKFIERRDSEYNELFYTLSRTIPNVITIMLTNRVNLEQGLQVILDSRVKDTFRYELVEFPDYTASELMDILRARCSIGLSPGSYEEGIVAMIGRKSYELGLRARGLLDTIRKAAEIAEAENENAISEQNVRDALKELSKDHDMEIIRKLPKVQAALLRYILQNPGSSAVVYDWYARELCPAFDIGASHTRFKDHIKQLVTIGVLDEDRHGLGRGRGQIVKLSVPADMTDIVVSSLRNQDTPTSTVDLLNQPHSLPHTKIGE